MQSWSMGRELGTQHERLEAGWVGSSLPGGALEARRAGGG